ncbi:unnamed protein product [Amoebophrya sp. A120]|nr:unnamed protein product [Amoebophrya sp. A120]|eukprot:GSA120T00002787001.1
MSSFNFQEVSVTDYGFPTAPPDPEMEHAFDGDASLRFAVNLGLVVTGAFAALLLFVERLRKKGKSHDYAPLPLPGDDHLEISANMHQNGTTALEQHLQSQGGAGGASSEDETSGFRKTKRNYLIAYLLAMFADWLQGPYVYALYDAYGFSKAQNGILFIFGFGSSMVFGTFLAGYADKFGRKKFCIFYCVVYTLSCFTKHVNHFYFLCLGRILAGIATSLLFSVFESWVVCEVMSSSSSLTGSGNTGAAKLSSEAQLSELFSAAIFGNSICAILAGFIAQLVSEGGGEFRRVFPVLGLQSWDHEQQSSNISLLAAAPLSGSTGGGGATTVTSDAYFYVGKFLGPFDVAAAVLACCGVFIHFKWQENYGSTGTTAGSIEESGSTGKIADTEEVELSNVKSPRLQELDGEHEHAFEIDMDENGKEEDSSPTGTSADKTPAAPVIIMSPSEVVLSPLGLALPPVLRPSSGVKQGRSASNKGRQLSPTSASQDHNETTSSTEVVDSEQRRKYDSSDMVQEEILRAPPFNTEKKSLQKPRSEALSDNEIAAAFHVLRTSPQVQKLGWMCALFESSMFIFVFLWTPAIHDVIPSAKKAPYGLIFALFMLACMCGSCMFSLLSSSQNEDNFTARANHRVPPGTKSAFAKFVSSCLLQRSSSAWSEKQLAALTVTVAVISNALVVVTSSTIVLLFAFLGFEFSLGLYFPTFGLLKSRLVPERNRAMLYNFFRVPLNFIVVASLAVDIPVRVGFALITCMLLLCGAMLWNTDLGGRDIANSTNRNRTRQSSDFTSQQVSEDEGREADEGVFVDEEVEENGVSHSTEQTEEEQQQKQYRTAKNNFSLELRDFSLRPTEPPAEERQTNAAGGQAGVGTGGTSTSASASSQLQNIKSVAQNKKPQQAGGAQIQTRSYAHGVLSIGIPAGKKQAEALPAQSTNTKPLPLERRLDIDDSEDEAAEDDGIYENFLVFTGSPRNSGNASATGRNNHPNADVEKVAGKTDLRDQRSRVGASGSNLQREKPNTAMRTREEQDVLDRNRLEQYLKALEESSSEEDGGI